MAAALTSDRAHWERVYAGRDVTGVSWYQAHPTTSLELIDALGTAKDAAVVDVGGGSSVLAARLVERGMRDVTVLDISPSALEAAKGRIGAAADAIRWIEADVRTWRPSREYGLWHDRAVFHFLVEAEDRAAYRDSLSRALAPGGAVVIATFAEDGPEQCSGLPVIRYGTDALAAELGAGYEVVTSRREEHVTPAGVVQPFTWLALRVRG